MNNTSNNDDSQSLSSVQRIDAICDRFELAWIRGERISIDKILEESPTTLRHALARELVAIEMELRRKAGEEPSLAQYAKYSSEEWLHGLRPQVESPNVGLNDATLDVPGTVPTAYGVQAGKTLPQNVVRYFGDYELIREIAHGGMGVVYQARQVSLDRTVAVKMILAGALASQQIVERFQREARAAALLDHPGIVPIYEVGVHNEQHFFSMGYIDGESLATKLAAGPMESKEAAALVVQISHAIQYAHERGVIHRDIKPSNILLDRRGVPRVADFGLAKRVDEGTELTGTGQILGTPSYMPPEQAACQVDSIGPESDVYSLGAMLYAMVTGRPPFQAASSVETLRQVIDEEVIPPVQLDRTIPKDLETIILKCLDKSRPRRYSSAQLLREDLERFLEDRPILARPVTSIEKGWRWCRRNPIVAGLSTLVSVLVLGTATLSSIAYLREAALRADLNDSLTQETKAKEEAKTAKEKAENAKVAADEAAKLALAESEKANTARIEKEHQAEIAEQEKKKANASEAATRRNLYISDVARIDSLVKESNFVRAKSLLERHIPANPAEEDLRGFDWFYNWRKVDQQRTKFQFDKPVEVMDLSSNGKLAVGCQGGHAYLLDMEDGSLAALSMDLGDEHWEAISLLDDNRVVGHGKQGGFKVWNSEHKTLLAHKPGAYGQRKVIDYVPANVSKNANFMICADQSNMLALWDLITLRPKPIPFLNEGLHSIQAGASIQEPVFYSNVWKITGTVPQRALMENKLDDSGFKNWDQFYIHSWAEQARKEYVLPGTLIPLPFVKNDPTNLKNRIGHPIRSLVMLTNTRNLVAGGYNGDVHCYDLTKIEDTDQWLDAIPKTIPIGKLPVNRLSTNASNTLVAACSDREFVLLSTQDWKEEFRMKSSDGEFSCMCFIDDQTYAIGRSNGFVEIRGIGQKEPIQCLACGTGTTTQLLVNQNKDAILVSSSDGSIRVFDLDRQPTVLIPQQYPDREVLVWLEKNQRLGIYSNWSDSLSVVSTDAPFTPTRFQQSFQGTITNTLGPAIFISDSTQSGNIVIAKEKNTYVWNLKTESLVRQFVNAMHMDVDGRSVPLGRNQHPLRSYEWNDGSLLETPILETKSNEILLSADLVDGTEKLAMLFGSTGLVQLVLLDLETGQALCELRIKGPLKQRPGSTFLKCIDQDRIFIDGIAVDDSHTSVRLVWNILDNQPEALEAMNSRTEALRGDSRKVKRLAYPKDDSHFAFAMEKTIHIVSSQNAKDIQQIEAPEDEKFEFAFITSEGRWHAILSNDRRLLRWATFQEHENSWVTLLDLKSPTSNEWLNDSKRYDFDQLNQILYFLEDTGKVCRWLVPSGQQLEKFQVPMGRVELIRRNSSGTMASLSRRTTPLGEDNALSWFQNDLPMNSSHSKRSFGSTPFVPLANPDFWITEHGIAAPSREAATADLPKLLTTNESFLTSRDRVVGSSGLVLSESTDNGHRLFQWQKNSLQVWTFDPSKSNQLQLTYGKRKSNSGNGGLSAHPTRISSSRDGGKVALSNQRELIWSSDPFSGWNKVQLPVSEDTEIVTTRWSRDSVTIGICLSTGDVLLYNPLDQTSTLLSRGHAGSVRDILWLPDNKTLATAGTDGKVNIWDVNQKELRLTIDAHEGGVWTLEFDENENTLYSGGEDGLIRKWIASSDQDSVRETERLVTTADLPIVVERAAPSIELIRNRQVAKRLVEIGVWGLGSSFGMKIGELSKLEPERIDEFAIHSIRCRGRKDFTDKDLSLLRGLRELRFLDLADCGITSHGLSELNGLTSLHTLDLSGIDLSEFDFNSLNEYSNLQVLRLHRCKLKNSHLDAIIRLFPGLQELQTGVSVQRP